MQPHELFHAVTAAFPRSFKPHVEWRDTVLEEVDAWAPHERVDAYKALKKSKSAAHAVTLEELRRARRGYDAPNHASSYVQVWLAYMREEGLYEFANKSPDTEVYTRRLVGVLWKTKPGTWREELDLIAGGGEAEDRVWRLYDYAKRHPLCATTSSEGWKLP